MNILEKFITLTHTTMQEPSLFGWFHLLGLAIVITVAILVGVKCKKLSDKGYKKVLLITGLTLIGFEILKQLNFAYEPSTDTWEYAWKQFPFQFCSVPMYIMVIVGLLKDCKLKDYLCTFLATYGLFAGGIVMLVPTTVLSDIIFRTSHSLLYHGTMLVIGVITIVSGKVKVEKTTILKAIPVFGVCVLIAFSMNIIFHLSGNDASFNMFYIGPYSGSDIPVLSNIGDALNIDADYLHFGNFVFIFLYTIAFSIAAFAVSMITLLIKKLNKKTA